MKRFWPYTLLAVCLSAYSLASCCRHRCDEPSGRTGVTIESDWSECADAQPQGMAYIFFSDAEAQYWRFDFQGTDAGSVMLPEGRYSFASFNDDTYHTVIDGSSYSSLRAYTWPAHLPHDIGNGQPVAESPDMLWGCAYRFVSLLYDKLIYVQSDSDESVTHPVVSPDFILTAYQRQITPRYRLTISDVENLSGVRSMKAALSGMAGEYFFDGGHKGSDPVTMTFNPEAADSTTITGRFSTFGLTELNDVSNNLYLFVILKDGRAFIYSFDVTDQVQGAPDPMAVDILLRGLVIERSDTPGGFDVAVDGWVTVNVNIDD